MDSWAEIRGHQSPVPPGPLEPICFLPEPYALGPFVIFMTSALGPQFPLP
jgi:hypothetical protein